MSEPADASNGVPAGPPPPQTHCPSLTYIPFEQTQPELSLSQRFEQQVLLYPDWPAISESGHDLTYAEVNNQSNAVAHAILHRLEASVEPVALLYGFTSAVVPAIMGTLKAGKFYVPLAPYQPPAHLSAILTDTAARILLTEPQQAALAREIAGDGCEVIVTSELPKAPEAVSVGVPTSARSLCYVMFTSGSTGQPKGVMQTHRNLMYYIANIAAAHQMAPGERRAMIAHFSLGISTSESFGALLTGGTICPFNIREHALSDFRDWIAEQRINHMVLIPSLFRRLVRTINPNHDFPQLRRISLGGEPVNPKDVTLFEKHLPAHCSLTNAYGSTELGYIATQVLNSAQLGEGNVVSVGRPFAGIEASILAEDGTSLPPGEIGEIALRTEYLSPGYWRSPELNQQVFLPDPDGGDRRTYLTRDLGYLQEDGALVHLGRKDERLKIRGYWVEPLEVEATLMALPPVAEAAVMTTEDAEGNRQLVAYYVSVDQVQITTGELRQALAECLPNYKLPSRFIRLETLPTLPGGKVDRQALASLATKQPTPRTLQAARTPTEGRMVRLWEQTLGVSPIGVTDDFFELGGDSLQAAMLMTEIETWLGYDLPLNSLIEAPTIEALARLADEATSQLTVSAVMGRPAGGMWAFQTEGDRPASFWVPSSYAEASTAHACVSLARGMGPDWPVYALAVREPGPDGQPLRTVQAVAADCIRRIRTVQPHGPYLVCGDCGGGITALEIAQQLVAAGEQLVALVLLDTPSSLPAQPRRSRLWRLKRKLQTFKESLQLPPGQRLPDLLRKLADHAIRSAEQNSPVAKARQEYMGMLAAYQPSVYPGRIILLATELDTRESPTLGWDRYAGGELEVIPIPGTHEGWGPGIIQARAAILRDALVRLLDDETAQSAG